VGKLIAGYHILYLQRYRVGRYIWTSYSCRPITLGAEKIRPERSTVNYIGGLNMDEIWMDRPQLVAKLIGYGD